MPAFPVQLAAVLTLHAAALIVMATTEVAVISKLVFLLAWGRLCGERQGKDTCRRDTEVTH